MTQQQLQTRLQQAEAETQRLRQYVFATYLLIPPIVSHRTHRVNEALMLGTAEQRAAAAAASLATQQAQPSATSAF